MVSDLIDQHPERFALLSYHVNDSYEIPWGLDRLNNFYSLNYATPTLMYDGIQNCGMSDYALCLDQRLAEASDMTIALTARQDGASKWTVIADICREGSGGSRNMRLYTAEALNDYPNPPEHSRNVLMQPAQTEDFSLSGGECTQILTPVTFDATSLADQNNIVVISWAQAPSATGPAEVYQAAVMTWPFPEASQLDRIEVSPQDVTMEEGEQVDFTASGFDQNGNAWDLTGADWSLSGTGSGTLSSETGPTTSLTATGAGNLVVTCTLGDVSGNASVLINPHVPVLSRIRIDPSRAEMQSGESMNFRASGVDEVGHSFPLDSPVWSLEDGLDGSLECSGVNCSFMAGEAGSGHILCQQDGVTGEALVEITQADPVLSALSISPDSVRMRVGETKVFQVSGRDQYGGDYPLENPEWRLEGSCSGDLDPLAGEAETTFTAGGEGSCLLYCREGDLEASAGVEVLAAGMPAPKRLRGRLSSSP